MKDSQMLRFVLGYKESHEAIEALIPYNERHEEYGVEVYLMNGVQLASIERMNATQYILRLF